MLVPFVLVGVHLQKKAAARVQIFDSHRRRCATAAPLKKPRAKHMAATAVLGRAPARRKFIK
jgi:hypothetical protein